MILSGGRTAGNQVVWDGVLGERVGNEEVGFVDGPVIFKPSLASPAGQRLAQKASCEAVGRDDGLESLKPSFVPCAG